MKAAATDAASSIALGEASNPQRKTPPDEDHQAGFVSERSVPKLGCGTAGQ
jgi:hypothetical protein